MMTKKKYFAGIDVGTTMTKAAVIDSDMELIASHTLRSGTDLLSTAETVFNSAVLQSGLTKKDIQVLVATGYGRKNVTFADDYKTEIGCHGQGCSYYFPEAITVIDIGGQDSKIIKLDTNGVRIGFKMNRKCAAGTGAFLEEMAHKLDTPLEKFNKLAKTASDSTKIGSYCTVFAATEVLDRINAGEQLNNIVRGLFDSIAKRIVEMDTLTNRVLMTGGVVAFNPIVADLLSLQSKIKVEIAPHPQMMGAFGAALFAKALTNND